MLNVSLLSLISESTCRPVLLSFICINGLSFICINGFTNSESGCGWCYATLLLSLILIFILSECLEITCGHARPYVHQHSEASQKIECWWPLGDAGLQPFWSLFGSLDLSGAYKLQSKMAWNVDAVVRYYLSVATECLVFNFSILFAVVGS